MYGTMSGRQLFAERTTAPIFLRPVVIDVRDMKAATSSSSSVNGKIENHRHRRPLSTLQLETEQQLQHGLHYYHVPFVVGAPARQQVNQFERLLQLLQLPPAVSASLSPSPDTTFTAARIASAIASSSTSTAASSNSSSSSSSLSLSTSYRAPSPKIVIVAHQADQAAAVADLLEKSGYANVFALNGGGFLDLVDAVNEESEYASKRF